MRFKLFICVFMTIIMYGCTNTEVTNESNPLVENTIIEINEVENEKADEGNEVNDSEKKNGEMNENLMKLLSSKWTDISSSEYLLYFDIDNKLILTGSRAGAIMSSYVYDDIEVAVDETAFYFHITKINNSSESENESTSIQDVDLIFKFSLSGNEVELIFDYYGDSLMKNQWIIDE